MRKHDTDIEHIRRAAKTLLYLDIAPTRIPFVATHPFTDTWNAGWRTTEKKDDTFEIIDLHDKDKQKEWRKVVSGEIDTGNLTDILFIITKPYRLLFLKMILPFISDLDLGECLSCAWVSVENISKDCNVNGSELVTMFKRADKTTLMTDEERKCLDNLDEEVTVWRGVTDYNKGRRKALSWTLDYQKAQWFALRYTKAGTVREVTVPRKRVLAYFSGRGEREIILNLYGTNFEFKEISVTRKKEGEVT